MDLKDMREQIDQIDRELVKLFVKRMQLSAQIAAYKQERGLPVFVPERESEILQCVADLSGAELEDYTRTLYATIFKLSRSYQIQRNAR